MSNHRLTEKRWQAIQSGDNKTEIFFYGNKKTKVLCRPGCKYKVENKKDIEIFMDFQEAINQGFFPCRKCKPHGYRITDEEWIKNVETILQLHYHENLNLNTISELIHSAPYYLHHKYKDITKKTLNNRLTEIRINRAKTLLRTSNLSIPEIGKKVGISNPTYFSTIFKNKVGKTPKKYKNDGLNNQLTDLLKDISDTLRENNL